MTPADIEKALTEVIVEIQSSSGLDCPPLTSSTIPANDIPSFDSKVWLVATTMLSSKIKTEIPDGEDIFVGKYTKEPLSINEICELISAISTTSKTSEEAA